MASYGRKEESASGEVGKISRDKDRMSRFSWVIASISAFTLGHLQTQVISATCKYLAMLLSAIVREIGSGHSP